MNINQPNKIAILCAFNITEGVNRVFDLIHLYFCLINNLKFSPQNIFILTDNVGYLFTSFINEQKCLLVKKAIDCISSLDSNQVYTVKNKFDLTKSLDLIVNKISLQKDVILYFSSGASGTLESCFLDYISSIKNNFNIIDLQ